MGLFDKIKSLLSPKQKKKELNWDNLGNTEPECPYCNHRLDRMPKRKINCPNCKEPIYKRTHGFKKIPILVTEESRTIIEEFYYEGSVIAKADEKFDRLRKDSQNQFLKHQNSSFALTQYQMGEQLLREKRPKSALFHFSIALHYNLNGADNVNQEILKDLIFDQNDPRFLKFTKGFLEQPLKIPPALIRATRKTLNQIQDAEFNLKNTYLESNKHFIKKEMSRSIDETWIEVKKLLEEKK